MKLTELEPKWLVKDGQRVGFIFRCPTRPEKRWQSCFLASPPRREQMALFAEAMGSTDGYPHADIQGCSQGTNWTIQGEFESLTCHPSLDGSAGGNWHGFITNGEIVGGL